MIVYEEILNILEHEFPEINRMIVEEGSHIFGLQHLIFSIVFSKYLVESFEIKDTKKLGKLITFIEKMNDEGDEKVKELAYVSVLECIISERELIKTIKKMCNNSLRIQIEFLEKETGWDRKKI